MGASKSKLSRTAASQAPRAYPSRPSPNVRARMEPQEPQEPARSPPPQASSQRPSRGRSEAIDTDAQDPAFAARLHALGVVPPNPFIPLSEQSQSSMSQLPGSSNQHRSTPSSPSLSVTMNPALLVLRARESLQRAYDEEQEALGRKGFAGRQFMEAARINEALKMRKVGVPDNEIEKRLGLAKGAVGRIGSMNVIDVAY